MICNPTYQDSAVRHYIYIYKYSRRRTVTGLRNSPDALKSHSRVCTTKSDYFVRPVRVRVLTSVRPVSAKSHLDSSLLP